MTQIPALERIQRERHIAQTMSDVLATHGIAVQVDPNELIIRDKVIRELTANQHKLSRLVLDRMFPREPAPCTLVHYTSSEGLAGIASSNELQLFAIRKRIGQAEIETFAAKHRLQGYLAAGSGEPYFKELSDDLFYTSFTRPGAPNDDFMWNVFAKGGTGARLEMRIVPAAAELRSIQYEQTSRTLLNALNDELASIAAAPFLPDSISKIGAFYLPSSLDVEGEVRLLMKRHLQVQLPTGRVGAFEYLRIPIGSDNPFCRLDVLKIEPGPRADADVLRTALSGTALQNALVIRALSA